MYVSDRIQGTDRTMVKTSATSVESTAQKSKWLRNTGMLSVMLLSLVGGRVQAQNSSGTHSHLDHLSGPPRTEVRELPVLADAEMLATLGIPALALHEETGVAYARVTSEQQAALSHLSHSRGRCGGFEALPYTDVEPNGLLVTHVFGQLSERAAKERRALERLNVLSPMVNFSENIDRALGEVSEARLRETVEFLSSYVDRKHTSPQPNKHVEALKGRIQAMLQGTSIPYEIDVITHNATRQNTLRVRVPGSARPNEIIVLGGHLDSINSSWMGGKEAPGADDNASGSANLVETLRILATQERAPERTIEFFWYAGEEGGLLGSSEIASQYKTQGKDVVAVLQLDMTMFPGDGELTLASMSDFTSAWLRDYLIAINTVYIKARILDSKCGYGCSDHASWHRQGYPALMPHEATFRGGNKDIHSSRDVIGPRTSFRHSAAFTKIALVMALDLGNSSVREP